MLNSLTLRQQHFLYQRKNLYNQEPSRSPSGETVPEDDFKTSWLEFFILLPSHRTLFWIRWCMSGQTRTAQSVFGRLAANRRMHGIENAALFNVPAHEIPSSVICHLIINYSFLPLLVKGISSCYDINQLKIVNFVCINVIKNDYRKEVMTWNSSMNW